MTVKLKSLKELKDAFDSPIVLLTKSKSSLVNYQHNSSSGKKSEANSNGIKTPLKSQIKVG